MAVKDLDTPLHRLMQYLEAGEYARLTDEFTDLVKEDFDERVQEVQIHTKDKRSFLFLKSFILKVRRKQYNAAHEHLIAARQQYQQFMHQYESLPDRKKQPEIKPNPQPNINEPKPAVIPNQVTNPGYRALPPAKSPPPAYTPRLQKRIQSPFRPESIPPTDIDDRLQPPIEREPPRPRQDIRHAGRPAIFRTQEASPTPIEKERKRHREPFLSVRSSEEYKLITPWKHVREFKPNVFSYDQDGVMPWLPAPEDVRPNFVSREDDYDRKIGIRNRYGPNIYDRQYGPNIRDSHLYANVYDTYKSCSFFKELFGIAGHLLYDFRDGSRDLPAKIERRLSPETSVIRTESQLQLEDLYNSQRPSKLAERFLDLYFGEYAHAFKELTTRGMKERNVVFYLLQIVTEAYEHCRTAVELNLNEKPNSREETSRNSGSSEANTPKFHVHPNLEQKRTKAAKLLPYAREDFIQKTYPDILPRKILTECLRTKAYAEKSMEVCWWMCVREPPITMEWVPERANDQPYQTFHRAIYGPYTQGGSHLEYTVWPAIRLYEHGPILSKGIAQGITPNVKGSA